MRTYQWCTGVSPIWRVLIEEPHAVDPDLFCVSLSPRERRMRIRTGIAALAACLQSFIVSYGLQKDTQRKNTDRTKKSNDVGSSPASWIDVRPYARASSTATLKRCTRSSSVSGGVLSNSCALSSSTPTPNQHPLQHAVHGTYL
jgi:hypothetical protein